MIFGIGTDIVELERISKVVERHGGRFTGYILTDSEAEEAERRGDRKVLKGYNDLRTTHPEIAREWSKERGSCAWRDIEIIGNPGGAPRVTLSGAGAETMKRHRIARLFVSISHERGHAIAMAVAEL